MGTYEQYRNSVSITRTDEFGVPRYQLNDGHEIPGVAFGTFDLAPDASTERAVAQAIEAGYRHIDCARLYGNEDFVGRGIKASGVPREQLFVSSKVWNDAQAQGKVRQSFMKSLDQLGVGYLDQFLLHWPVPGAFRQSWEVLQELQSEGLVRSIGVSNFNRAALDELLSDGAPVPVINQMEHHPLDQQMDTIAACAERGILYEAWSPLGRGDVLQLPQLEALAQQAGVSTAQLVLAWHVRKRVVAVPRSANQQHIVSNIAAASLQVDDAILAKIDEFNCNQPVLAGVAPDDFSMLDGVPSDF